MGNEVVPPNALEFIPDHAYLTRPYADESMIYKEVQSPQGTVIFTIDPWTRRWAILEHSAVALLRLANGRRRLSEIIRILSDDDTVARPAKGFAGLAVELQRIGLLLTSQAEHRASGLPVYNKSEMIGLHLEITNACNMHCQHCYVAAGNKLDKELSFEEIIKTIDMLPPFSGKLVAISGGEPIVRKDCMDIVEYCAVQCGHSVDLYTNGKWFPERLARKILDVDRRAVGKVRVQVSLEGATAETHDMVRGPKAFRYLLKTLDMFKRVGLSRSTTLFACITKHNIVEIDEMIELAERYDVSMLVFSQWQKQGNASDTPWASIAPTVEEWVEAGEKLLKYDNPRLKVFGNFFGDLNNNQFGRYSLESSLFPKHTYFYNAFPRVTPDGHVFADQLWVDPDWILGNVRDGNLEDCFDTPKFYDQLAQMRARIESVQVCQACEWKELCQCGSAGHTYAEYGHMNEKDLFCDSRIYWFERYVEHQTQKAFKG